MRLRIRALLAAALTVASVLPACAQRREGVFVPNGGSGIPWSINGHHTLVWNGEPYLPVGLRIDGDPAAVTAARDAGIKDVIVELPANGTGWAETIKALEDAKMRYVIRIGSLAPTARGIAVEPQAYRVAGISKPRRVTIDLPGATSAFAVVASRRDGSVSASGPATVKGGSISYDAKPGGEIEHVLLLYPELTSLEQPDFWERLDAHRDSLLATLRRNPPGPGFRGLVNPMGRTLSLPGRDLRFVPTSATFRMELREHLEKRHRSVVTAMKGWGMGPNSFTTFDELARLVPLWQGSRGVGLLLDPTTGRTYTAEQRQNTIWQDMSEVVAAAGSRRFARFVAAIRSVVDVPVVQEWSGWAAAYEASAPAVDGVGMRATGTTPSAIAESGSRAASTVMRWSTPGWLPATDVDPGGATDFATQLPAVVDDLTSLGARGVFIRTDSPELAKAIAAEGIRRAADTSPATTSPRPIFFPENATNPAVVQRLPGNGWWLPAPSDGNRIELGSMFFAYRMRQRDVGNALAIWTRVPGRYRLRMVNTKGVGFQALNGSDPKPKSFKGGIEVDLTEIPLLVVGSEEIPIPEIAYMEAMQRFDVLVKAAEAERREVAEERIVFRDAVQGFDRNPGGNFGLMSQTLVRLGNKIGTSTWLEAERTPTTNFSEPANFGGCSGNQALVLRTPIPGDAEGYFAEYKFPVRTGDEQTVWIAARIPREKRGEVQIRLAGQTMVVTGEPTGLYGDGFGWYKLGTTRLAAGNETLRVQVAGLGGADLAIDVIVMTPRAFQPSGVTMPDPIEFPPLAIKK
ncbi:MAG: hypothetical protein ACO1SV_02715 [Fimbriimonas sp.]